MSEIKIPETSLCMIVKNEIENPAGGIRDAVDSMMPFLERGVIVDTGSVDGTRETLEELKRKYPGLEVYDRTFDNFPNSRNYALEQVKTKRVFVLDADERLSAKGFEKLAKIVSANPKTAGFSFYFMAVLPEGFISIPAVVSNGPRLFTLGEKIKYGPYEDMGQEYCDQLFDNGYSIYSTSIVLNTSLHVGHFIPSLDDYNLKKELYRRSWDSKTKRFVKDISPSSPEYQSRWKESNPLRNRIDEL